MKDMKFLSLLLLLGILNTSAQPTLKRVDGSVIRAATLDTALPNIMRQAGVIGLNIAVVNGAMPVYHGVFGWRDREAALPPDTNTVLKPHPSPNPYLRIW
jgi:hypothetical protein